MSYLKVTMRWNILCISLVFLSLPLIQEVSSQGPSCEGRCFEAFERGRECDCDADCERYGKCCPDYAKHCKEAHTEKPSPETPPENKSTSKRSSTDEEKLPEEAVEDPGTGLENPETTPAPTTEAAETTPAATEPPTTQTDPSTTPQGADPTPDATEEPATEELPSTEKPEDVTPDATEEPATEGDSTNIPPTEDTTPEATEAPTTEAESPTTPKPEETTPEATEAPTTEAESPTTPKPEENTTAEIKEVTTPKKDRTTLLKDILTAAIGKDTATVAVVTTAKPGDSPEGMDDIPDAAKQPVPAAAASEATTAATAPLPKPTATKAESTPEPSKVVTPSEKETSTETEQAAAATESTGSTCVVVMTTAGKKEVTTPKEVSTTPARELAEVTEKAPGTDKAEATTVAKETTTRDKKDTIEEMYLVSNGTSKPTIHFHEVTESREDPHPADPETLPVKEPEINKPLIPGGDLPMLPGETQVPSHNHGTTAAAVLHGPLYWRFTNGVMDPGYPKPLANGFAGLSGKIVATLPVARYNNRPESVYFIKRDGNMQQYVYRQEPAKKCQRRARITIRYPAFVPRVVIRRRFQRAVQMPTVIRTVRVNPHPSGVLRKEIQMTTYWRGLPKVIHSTLSIPNQNKPDGYDYYAFSYNRYYSLDISKRIARPVTALTGKTVSKDWYNCPSK
ncbi:proteoglycan 4 [Empidonax traillii]|uniref:proteoglycan 4 n=1 Tax=Empidonax traillii TaxID=164674 RepID=UPI000FFD04D2|nr:proteoglycan 4 [Empidonax traillii]